MFYIQWFDSLCVCVYVVSVVVFLFVVVNVEAILLVFQVYWGVPFCHEMLSPAIVLP